MKIDNMRKSAMTLALLGAELPLAAFVQTRPAATADGRIETLEPGAYLWAPEIAPAGPVIETAGR